MSDLVWDAERAELNALITAGEQHEAGILDWAQHALVGAESTAVAALEGGFRAKVPLAGGSIANAIGAAAATLEGEQATDLKALFDKTLAQLRAAAASPPAP